MQIFMLVLQLLNMIAPLVAQVLAAINESKSGGIKSFDELLKVALIQVRAVEGTDFPGDTQHEKDIKKYLWAVDKTLETAIAMSMVVQTSEVMKAVQDAYMIHKQSKL